MKKYGINSCVEGERAARGDPVEALSKPGRYTTMENGLEIKDVIPDGDSEARGRYVVVRNVQWQSKACHLNRETSGEQRVTRLEAIRMALLELKGVTKIYQQGKIEVPALRGIDLMVEAGEFTTVFGPSGSGKTTLLNVIGCLDKPSSGSIKFNGKQLEDLDRKALAMIRRHNVGFIFQSYNLIPVLTAYENVEFAVRLISKDNKSEIKDRVMKILADVGLEGLEDRKPNELSGGQKQRVAIARALVKEPKLILADEPSANLDSKSSEEVLEVMVKMNKELGTTFIFSTHDPRVMDYARRLIEIRDGLISRDQRRESKDVPN